MTLKQWVGRLPSCHRAHKEYDSLSAEVERVKTCHDILELTHAMLDPGDHPELVLRIIEELDGDCPCPTPTQWDALTAEKERLAARAEELEKERDDTEADYENLTLLFDDAHLVTPEMIDAAVQWIENLYSGDNPTRLSMSIIEIVKRYLWKLLNKLNIFRCEHPTCEGGTIPGPSLGRVKHTACNGHGWVIKNKHPDCNASGEKRDRG